MDTKLKIILDIYVNLWYDIFMNFPPSYKTCPLRPYCLGKLAAIASTEQSIQKSETLSTLATEDRNAANILGALAILTGEITPEDETKLIEEIELATVNSNGETVSEISQKISDENNKKLKDIEVAKPLLANILSILTASEDSCKGPGIE
ncbi:MAG: hypothetical protein HKL80_03700, partial [Acidimicrobiales bacterium]|nr:hypothetical protein [Acidimicrobiales bacterium]